MYGVFFLMQVEKDCQYSREFMHLLTFFKSVKKKTFIWCRIYNME